MVIIRDLARLYNLDIPLLHSFFRTIFYYYKFFEIETLICSELLLEMPSKEVLEI